jgi:hypothetical protein
MILKPEAFYGETPPDRIIGTEAECNVQIPEGITLNQYMSDRAVELAGFQRIKDSCGYNDGYFYDNGCKIYRDVGHLEVSSAESRGPRQAVVSDLAGMLALRKIIEASGVPHQGVHRHSGTIIGSSLSTSGYHENYLMPVKVSVDPLVSELIPSHLASRLYSLSGIVGAEGFQLSQKVNGIGGTPITSTYGRRTSHGNKPMAMIPVSDTDTIGSGEWRRLEVRFADAGFSPTARFLTFAATSLVLRLIEHQPLVDTEVLEHYAFKDPVRAAKVFNNDLSFTATAETQSGEQISALDYQEILLTACARLANVIQLPEDEAAAIPLWADVCDAYRRSDLENRNYDGLLDITDLAVRHRYLTNRFLPHEISSENKRAVAMNLVLDRILPTGGSMKYWASRPSPYVSQAEVEDRIHNPPGTRAALRSNAIRTTLNKSFGSSYKVKEVNWSTLLLHDEDDKANKPTVSLSPAYVTE